MGAPELLADAHPSGAGWTAAIHRGRKPRWCCCAAGGQGPTQPPLRDRPAPAAAATPGWTTGRAAIRCVTMSNSAEFKRRRDGGAEWSAARAGAGAGGEGRSMGAWAAILPVLRRERGAARAGRARWEGVLPRAGGVRGQVPARAPRLPRRAAAGHREQPRQQQGGGPARDGAASQGRHREQRAQARLRAVRE